MRYQVHDSRRVCSESHCLDQHQLSADSPELCNVVGVVCLAECGITWQSTNALNSTHFKQYLSCCEVNVKQIKRISAVR